MDDFDNVSVHVVCKVVSHSLATKSLTSLIMFEEYHLYRESYLCGLLSTVIIRLTILRRKVSSWRFIEGLLIIYSERGDICTVG